MRSTRRRAAESRTRNTSRNNRSTDRKTHGRREKHLPPPVILPVRPAPTNAGHRHRSASVPQPTERKRSAASQLPAFVPLRPAPITHPSPSSGNPPPIAPRTHPRGKKHRTPLSETLSLGRENHSLPRPSSAFADSSETAPEEQEANANGAIPHSRSLRAGTSP